MGDVCQSCTKLRNYVEMCIGLLFLEFEKYTPCPTSDIPPGHIVFHRMLGISLHESAPPFGPGSGPPEVATGWAGDLSLARGEKRRAEE